MSEEEEEKEQKKREKRRRKLQKDAHTRKLGVLFVFVFCLCDATTDETNPRDAKLLAKVR